MSILDARLKAGLSQVEVAKKLGVTPSTICQWEKGETAPKFKRLAKLAELYGCSVDDFIDKTFSEK